MKDKIDGLVAQIERGELVRLVNRVGRDLTAVELSEALDREAAKHPIREFFLNLLLGR